MSGALLYIRYTVSLRLISSQSLIIEETNTHTMKDAEKIPGMFRYLNYHKEK